MAKLGFDGLPPYSYLGGPIDGSLVLETDKPMRARDLTLTLRGYELGQVTVQAGRSSQTLVETAPLLETGYTFRGQIPFEDPDHIAPGSYRLPFHFDIPVSGTPSLATHELPAVRGRFGGRPDGMYVEYELEARVEVPWWVDPIDRYVVPVYSPRRVLGVCPPLVSASDPDRPQIVVTPDPGALLPGNAWSGAYQVTNPRAKELKSLLLSLSRLVRYTVRGNTRSGSGPVVSVEIPLQGRAPSYSGRFSVGVPNVAESTGPWQGKLFQTYWVATSHLGVSLGFDVVVEGPLVPG